MTSRHQSCPASDGVVPVLKLSLPPAPPLNNIYANVRGRGRVKTAKYRRWLRQADAHYMVQKLHLAEKITVPYTCRMWFPPGMRSDIDARAKAILDWMVSRGLTIDDRHCRRLMLDMEQRSSELVYIEVEPYAESEHGESRTPSVGGASTGLIRNTSRGHPGPSEG